MNVLVSWVFLTFCKCLLQHLKGSSSDFDLEERCLSYLFDKSTTDSHHRGDCGPVELTNVLGCPCVLQFTVVKSGGESIRDVLNTSVTQSHTSDVLCVYVDMRQLNYRSGFRNTASEISRSL